MHKINSYGNNAGEFTDGNPGSGIPSTVVDSAWLNSVQRELIAILTASGLTPDVSMDNQVQAAIAAQIAAGGGGVTRAKWVTVANQAARLALNTALQGDGAVQTDNGHTYVLKPSGVYSNNSDWLDIAGSGGGAVSSVNGYTGAVTLAKSDVGLGSVDNTADTAKPVSTAQATAIAAKVSKAGDTMTGLLVLSADPSAPLNPATKQYTDAADALALPKSGGTMTGTLVLAADPVNPNDASTKNYVDSLSNGAKWKNAARAATTANITLSAPQTIDGVPVIAGDRVLVKNQTTSSQDGIYLVAAGAWTRAPDAATYQNLNSAAVYVSEGTLQADRGYYQSAELTSLSSNQTWGQNFGNGAYSADEASLTVVANVFSAKALGITNTHLATGILRNKLAALTASSPMRTDASGFDTTGAIGLNTSDVTGALQLGNGGSGQTTLAGATAAYGSMQTVIVTGAGTLTNASRNLTDTSAGGFTSTLPPGSTGAQLRIADRRQSWDTNNLIVAPATGEAIGEGAANATVTCNVKRGWLDLAWDGSRWVIMSLASTSTSPVSGGLTPTGLITATGTSTNNTTEEFDTTAGSLVRTLPVTTAAGSIKYVDATGACSATNFLRITPGSGDKINGYTTADSLVLRRKNVFVQLDKPAGSTTWYVTYQTVSTQSSSVILGSLRVNTANGYGSINSRIRRFSVNVFAQGSGFTFNQSATLGDDITITENGIYSFHYCETFSGAGYFGLSKNSSQLTTNVNSISAASRLCVSTNTTANYAMEVSWTGYLAAGDVIRAHTDTTASGGTPDMTSLSVQQIVKG